jgi:hypothetical protein
MTHDQVRKWFLKLPASSKPLLVALLSHNLTVAARASYPGQISSEAVASRFRTFNELQHTVSAKLIALNSGDVEQFPDEGFLDVLFEKARYGDCENDLLQAFAWSAAVKT